MFFSTNNSTVINDITADDDDQSNVSNAEDGRHLEFEVIGQTRSASDQQKLLYEKIAKMELEKKLLQAELREHKLMAQNSALLATVAKIKKQQQNNGETTAAANAASADQLKTLSKRVNELEKQKQQQTAKFDQQLKSAQQKIDQLIRQQQKDQQTTALCAKIDQLERKQLKILAQNWWDVNACHGDLTITGPKCSVVHHKGNAKDHWRSIIAKHSILSSDSGIFYFEVLIESLKSCVGIGMATKAMPLDKEWVGKHSDSFGYISYGTFWLNGANKCGNSPFSAGDVVGCSVNLANRQIIFTKNGRRLAPINLCLPISSIDSLFPCATLRVYDAKIEANFGPHFQFDVGNL